MADSSQDQKNSSNFQASQPQNQLISSLLNETPPNSNQNQLQNRWTFSNQETHLNAAYYNQQQQQNASVTQDLYYNQNRSYYNESAQHQTAQNQSPVTILNPNSMLNKPVPQVQVIKSPPVKSHVLQIQHFPSQQNTQPVIPQIASTNASTTISSAHTNAAPIPQITHIQTNQNTQQTAQHVTNLQIQTQNTQQQSTNIQQNQAIPVPYLQSQKQQMPLPTVQVQVPQTGEVQNQLTYQQLVALYENYKNDPRLRLWYDSFRNNPLYANKSDSELYLHAAYYTHFNVLRSAAIVQAEQALQKPQKKPRTPKKAKMTENPEGEPATPKQRKPRKSKQTQEAPKEGWTAERVWDGTQQKMEVPLPPPKIKTTKKETVKHSATAKSFLKTKIHPIDIYLNGYETDDSSDDTDLDCFL